MKFNLSHRWQIALAAGGVAAVLFAIVLGGTYGLMVRMERHAARELLDAPLEEAVNALNVGDPLDQEIAGQEDVTIAVFGPDGRKIFQSGRAPVSSWHGRGELIANGRSLLYRSEPHSQDTVVAAIDWTEPKSRLGAVRTTFVMLLLPLSLVVGLAAYIAAGLMFKPLKALTHAAREMAIEGKAGHLEEPRDAEFSPLVRELNVLLSRISAEVERQERLVSDVAHDLSTPLTVIRGRLETALMRDNADEYRPAIKTVIRETERLSAMAEAILRSERMEPDVPPLELSAIATEAVERWSSAFARRGAKLTGSFDECRSKISEEEWTSVLDNLLDNAFKYGGDRCKVALICRSTAKLEVTDNGPGIDPSERRRVFERFTRLDSSRGSNGHGLGLYLCSKIFRARGGSIGIEDGEGMRIIGTLPLIEAGSDTNDLASKET